MCLIMPNKEITQTVNAIDPTNILTIEICGCFFSLDFVYYLKKLHNIFFKEMVYV